MVIAFPWAGRDWNRAIAISGRAAMPGLPGGSGFNWPSLVGTTGMLRPRAALSGLGAMARRRSGRGLGQPDMSTMDSGPILATPVDGGYTPVDWSTVSGSGSASSSGTPFPQTSSVSPTVAAQGGSTASTGAPWWGSLLTAAMGVGKQITSYELNPLTNKATYIQTPQGGIIASNSPALAVNAAGVSAVTGGLSPLSTASLSSMMPLLLIGGGLVVVMMMAKR